MSETKYGKHILKNVIKKSEGGFASGYSILAHEGELSTDCSMGYHCISAPIEFDKPHAHEFTEILCFIGDDPKDIRSLGAEVEICLGEEQEKHIIDTAAVVSIPAGLVHCPLTIKNVKRPIIFLEISLTPNYGPSVARTKKE
ncbi:MAG: hypothetical protein JXA46_19805 [Dehalococcoidales bacterium]|nr:hypothetical protein [Dehalococcoidales bacterium]